ncbi:hypothetical protein [Comamonas sp. MYb396]|uniref:hypothetical protein n=1 Tax=Comamonas sp. MYb396 TaxID=2745302 RepID=UPI0030DD3089
MAAENQARFLLGTGCFSEECSKINAQGAGKYMYPGGHIPGDEEGHHPPMLMAITIWLIAWPIKP